MLFGITNWIMTISIRAAHRLSSHNLRQPGTLCSSHPQASNNGSMSEKKSHKFTGKDDVVVGKDNVVVFLLKTRGRILSVVA